MPLKSLLHAFRRHERRPQYESQCRVRGCVSSIVRWFSRISKSCRKKPRLEHFTPYLPHTVVTCNFEAQEQVFELYFSHFFTGNPSIAVFSSSQCGADPINWRPRRVNVRYGWRRNRQHVRQLSTTRIIVGSGCQHEVSVTSIHHWDPAWGGTLLVNWEAMYEDYFAQERRERKKERAFEIRKRCRRLEERT
ncbi:hypothetical protein BDU57DRAFT_515777 [Ampelomyces quisqualis]|uniref:Uncharacterized protein n=1 Tax=Ampelomyces quisqualis TaxID=50730 RepID=A0A6A5QM42_AMPQU|nr:hypothetical protein BDU57DRAFT_515777 [Ampelomyces quisqualis]